MSNVQYDNEKICEQIDFVLDSIINKMSSFKELNKKLKFHQYNQTNENFCFLRKLERMKNTITSGIFEYTAKSKKQNVANNK